MAGTYYAQAREYQVENGRFSSQDIIGGFIEVPITINRYRYCWENPEKYVDLDGKLPTILVGAFIGGIAASGIAIVGGIIAMLDSLEKLQDMPRKEWLTEQGMDSVKKL